MRVAYTMAALLEAEAIPAHVTSESTLIGEALLWEVRVPIDQLEAARGLLNNSNFTDPELVFLSTGALDSTDDSE
jgi:hypothetical protein